MIERILKRIWFSFVALIGILLIFSVIVGIIWGTCKLHVYYGWLFDWVVIFALGGVILGSPIGFCYFIYGAGKDIQVWWENKRNDWWG